TEHDRVQAEVVVVGIPATQAHAAEHAQQRYRVDVAAPRHAVLAVRRESHVLNSKGPSGSYLGRFLAEAGRPQAELTLPLKRSRFAVEPSHERQVAIKRLDLVIGDLKREVGVIDSHTFRRQQLNQIWLRRDV